MSDGDQVPYNFIGSRKGRHGWENFAPLAMASLPHNLSNIPSMYPLGTLANFSLFTDMLSERPVQPQGTLWVEIWRNEATNASREPACTNAASLDEELRRWDEAIQQVYASQL